MHTANSTRLAVDLGRRSYEIIIGTGLLDEPASYINAINSRRVLVITNTVVAPLYLQRLCAALDDFELDTLVLPDGEAQKTLATTSLIYDHLLQHGYGRDATIVALGGGVLGDIAGFAAATYQRGIDFVQVPTTLLAQVDSSVGGKTGVNHPLGKNMIGAFHQPTRVIADTEVLATLPDRELSAGLAEVIKYGLIRDPEFFAWLEANIERLCQREPAVLSEAIRRSCANKAAIVAADEREAGVRALLNLGHTYGHALEAALGYGQWLHGEAVAAGMCMAADTSHRLGWVTGGDVQRIEALLQAAGLPTTPPARLYKDAIHELMTRDKKALAGQLRLVLLKNIGTAVVTTDYGDACKATLEHYLST